MNKLFLISGPSGSGKTTIMRGLMMNEIVSFTTRAKREGEVEGVDYHFITLPEFEKLRTNDGLIETSEYGGNYYGITKNELEYKTDTFHAFAIVDCAGAQKLAELYRNVASIFIYATCDDCEANMRDRGSLQPFIEQRLSTYAQEMRNRVHYDYVVRNIRGRYRDALEIVRRILLAEMST